MKTELRLDLGTAFKSLILLFIFAIPTAYVHELGHSMVCTNQGAKAEIQMSFTGIGNTNCIGTLHDQFTYHLAGGLLAGLVAAIPLVLWKKIPSYAKIVSLSLAAGQFINMIVETFAYSSYINDTGYWSGMFGIIDLVLFVGLVFYFARGKRA